MIIDRKTDLPPELQAKYHDHERKSIDFLEKKDFDLSEKEYRTLLSKIIEAQGTTDRYHKGGPYHQIGYILFLQKKYDEALKFFQYAFIEDSITEPSFPHWPAAQNLMKVYGISYSELFTQFNKIRNDYNSHNIPQDPEEYLVHYVSTGKKISKENKVFVGGNYKNIALLRYIEDIITNLNLGPILPINFSEERSEYIYLHSMLLLEDCGYAIFEITFDAGHLMEIERVLGKEFIPRENILLLFQQRSRCQKDHYITKMLMSPDIKLQGYTNVKDLDEIIRDFFKKTPK